VTYNGNSSASGSVPVDSSSYASGASVTVLGNTGTLAKTGYTFAGWCTTQPAAGSACTATSRSAASTFAITSDTTLYAQWTATTLTITYDSQSGSAISSGSTTTGGSISSSPGTPTRSGYTFNGWFTAPSGGSAISFAYVHGQTANFTLYAQWTAAATCASGGVCAVGDIGPGGGTVFYVAPTTFTQTNASGTMCTTACKYLEYAPLNWGTTLSAISGCTAGTATADPRCKYGSVIITPVTSTAIGAGYNNTLLILAADSGGNAARVASSYRASGFTDWFLPSANEMFELCKYATVGRVNCSGTTTAQDLTYKTVLSAEFTENSGSSIYSQNNAQYWTSSRAGTTTTYYAQWRRLQTSATGNNVAQDQNIGIRAVRAFG
jgi:uncharacterized repeat protein (TIGR02543 family)